MTSDLAGLALSYKKVKDPILAIDSAIHGLVHTQAHLFFFCDCVFWLSGMHMLWYCDSVVRGNQTGYN